MNEILEQNFFYRDSFSIWYGAETLTHRKKSEILVKFWKLLLEKDREVQLYLWREKWSITNGRERK